MTIVIIIGAIILLLILFAMQDAKNTVTGLCPKCNTKIGLRKGIGCCGKCGEPLKSDGGKFVSVEPGLVSDNFSFSVSMAKLKNPKKWQTTRQGRCCICGSTAAKTQSVNVKTISGSAGPLLGPHTNFTESTKFEVGYCAAHRDGIKFLYPPGFGNAKRTEQCFLYFRSVDFYREFMKQNAIWGGTIELEPELT